MSKKRVHEIAKEHGSRARNCSRSSKLPGSSQGGRILGRGVRCAEGPRRSTAAPSSNGSATAWPRLPRLRRCRSRRTTRTGRARTTPAADTPAAAPAPAAGTPQRSSRCCSAAERVRRRVTRDRERTPGDVGPGGRRRVVIDSQASRRQQADLPTSRTTSPPRASPPRHLRRDDRPIDNTAMRPRI